MRSARRYCGLGLVQSPLLPAKCADSISDARDERMLGTEQRFADGQCARVVAFRRGEISVRRRDVRELQLRLGDRQRRRTMRARARGERFVELGARLVVEAELGVRLSDGMEDPTAQERLVRELARRARGAAIEELSRRELVSA